MDPDSAETLGHVISAVVYYEKTGELISGYVADTWEEMPNWANEEWGAFSSLAILDVASMLTGIGIGKKAVDVAKPSGALAKVADEVVSRTKEVLTSAKKHRIDLKKFDVDRFKNNPLKEAKYSRKVQEQMQLGDYHAFPKEVDNFAGMGTRKSLVGGDGIPRTKVELPGSYDGK